MNTSPKDEDNGVLVDVEFEEHEIILLEATAAARGVTVEELVHDLVAAELAARKAAEKAGDGQPDKTLH